jgi:hypothetical protein
MSKKRVKKTPAQKSTRSGCGFAPGLLRWSLNSGHRSSFLRFKTAPFPAGAAMTSARKARSGQTAAEAGPQIRSRRLSPSLWGGRMPSSVLLRAVSSQ